MTTSELVYLPFWILMGLLWGSFLGVLIHRGPQIWGLSDDESSHAHSLAWPPSHCPACQTPIRLPALIPLLGFALSRGQCSACGVRIPAYYPIVEGLGILAGLLAALLFETWLASGITLAFFLLLIALAVIDQRTGYLPDALTMPLLALGLFAGINDIYIGANSAALGWIIGWGALATLAGLYRTVRGQEGLGGGDAKLLGAGACFTGPMGIPLILFIAAALALAVLLIIGKGKVDPEQEIRFGPWLAGAIVTVFVFQTAWPGLLP